MEPAFYSKLTALILMFIITLFFGLIPIKIRKYFVSHSKRVWISYCLCFGAGVLLGTIFLHLLPETKESFEGIWTSSEGHKEMSYPYTELIFCLGFLLIYFLEELVFFMVHRSSYVNHRRKSTPTISSQVNKTELVASINGNNTVEVVQLGTLENKPLDSRPSSEASKEKAGTTLLRSIMIVLALSLHGCFEGLVVGFEKSSKDVWLLFLTISCHKIAISFSLGMELLEQEIEWHMYYIQMISFASAAPVGGLIGAIMKSQIDSSNQSGLAAIAILQALSGGTILFIIFCEVLERERPKPSNKFSRFCSFLLGFILIAILQIFDKDGDC